MVSYRGDSRDDIQDVFGARRGSMDGMAAFGARCGSRPSGDGPDQMRMTYLMQDFLPFHP